MTGYEGIQPMTRHSIMLRSIGGILGGILGTACSDGEVPKRAPEQTAAVAPDLSGSNAVVQTGHSHAAGDVLELDGSELSALPKNLGDRLFDTVVRIGRDGTAQRKVIETTVEQRERTATIARDFQGLLQRRESGPSKAELDGWRASWGLPTKEESARMLDELMEMPFDVMLHGELSDELRVEIEGGRVNGLDVVSGAEVLAASGWAYINAPGGGSSGGACAPYIYDDSGIVYWSGINYTGNVLCIYNIYNTYNGTNHTKYIHFTHSAYWPSGEDVDSYISSAAWFGARDPDDTGSGVATAVGSWVWDSDSSQQWIDNCGGSCIDPFQDVACWA